jgi:hypothetical protein
MPVSGGNLNQKGRLLHRPHKRAGYPRTIQEVLKAFRCNRRWERDDNWGVQQMTAFAMSETPATDSSCTTRIATPTTTP